MKIAGNVFLVTGGASGLGEAVVRKFVKRGAMVCIADLNDDAKALAEELGDNAVFSHCDVRDPASVKSTVAEAQTLGYLTGVVHCAGIATGKLVIGKDGSPWDIHDFMRTVNVNLGGSFLVASEVAAAMVSTEGPPDGERGVIILTSSIAAYEGQKGQAAYSASKAGVNGMILPMAREFSRHGIRVMGIAPGVFNTPMMAGMAEHIREALAASVPHPKRLGTPEEFASLAMHVVENGYLNGEVIRLDGAIRMV